MTWIGTRQPDGTVSHEEMRQMGTYFSDSGREEQRVMDQRWENSYLAARLEAALERIDILEQQVAGLDAEQQRLLAPPILHIPEPEGPIQNAGWTAPSEAVYDWGSALQSAGWTESVEPEDHENEPIGMIRAQRGGIRYPQVTWTDEFAHVQAGIQEQVTRRLATGVILPDALISYGDYGSVTINSDGSVETVSEPAPDVSAGQTPNLESEHHITWYESGANPPADLLAQCSCFAAASGPEDYVRDWIDKHIQDFGTDVTVRRLA